MVSEGLRAFLEVIRQAHPAIPIVVASPILRPDAEDVPNKLGATLVDIRRAIESVTTERMEAGDVALSLVPGAGIINAGHLADGIHPGDEGHKRIAAAMTRALTVAMDAAAARSAEAEVAEAVAVAEAEVVEAVVAEAEAAEVAEAEALEQAVEAQADIPKRVPAAGRGAPKQGRNGLAVDAKDTRPVRRMTRKSPPKSAAKSATKSAAGSAANGAANGVAARGPAGNGSRSAAAVAAAAKKAAEAAAEPDPERDGSELDHVDEPRGSGRPALAYAAYGN